MILRSLGDIAEEVVSHNPNVRKRVWIHHGEIPNVTQIARSIVPPGELCGSHTHSDMWEMFLVERGEGEMKIDDRECKIKKGDCLIVVPGESHELKNRSDQELVLTVIGWTDAEIS